MSHELISHSEDLQRLVHEGYELEIRAGYLILHRVPYVTSKRVVRFGQLVCPITINGSSVGRPADHTVYFAGEYPCDDQGVQLEALRNSSARQELSAGLWIDHYFSAKPSAGNYDDFHHKLTHYSQVLGRYARRLDPTATSRSGSLVLSEDPNDPFVFMETASSRVGITRMNERLAGDRIGIVGLGGTGSYILDFVSKTRVSAIHLFDGDEFQQHNAFRSPGTTSPREIGEKLPKVYVYRTRYEKMRGGIVAHNLYMDADSLETLECLDFVFVAIDDNDTRQWLLPALLERGIPFLDVGMGVEKIDDQLLGIVRTSFSVTARSSAPPSGEGEARGVGEYERNAQVAELNALNAALAVIRWKKYRGFYLDLRREDRSNYTIDGNHLINVVVGEVADSS